MNVLKQKKSLYVIIKVKAFMQQLRERLSICGNIETYLTKINDIKSLCKYFEISDFAFSNMVKYLYNESMKLL